MSKVKTGLLFVGGVERARNQYATFDYLLERSIEFADAFLGDVTDPAWPIYSRLFVEAFGPGMLAKPHELFKRAIQEADAAMEVLGQCETSRVERIAADAKKADVDAAAADRAEQARAGKVERETEQAEAELKAETEAVELLSPATLEGVRIVDLDIPQLAKNAYARTGLETVGDLLTYKAAQPLEAIKGISDKYEAITIAAIDAMRPSFDVSVAPIAE
jgi:hypothetical protein